MLRTRVTWLVLVALATGGYGAPRGAADVVTTLDGVEVEGEVERQGERVIVKTADGEVVLASADVRTVTAGESARGAARRAAAALAQDDVVGRYRLAASADAQGLADVAAELYLSILAQDPEHAAARRALGHERVDGVWRTTAQARRQRGLVLYQGRWLLPAEVDRLALEQRRSVRVRATDLSAALRTAATGSGALASAARAQVAAAKASDRLEVGTGLLAHGDARVRAYAAAELGRLGDESAIRPLLSVAARDRSDAVRRAAVTSLASFGRADVAFPLVRALFSEHPSVVANAAASLGWLGDRHAVVWLVTRLTGHGSSPASYFAHMTQHAYLQDFDVEVAQTSFVADPVIGTLQEGVAQDVKVLDLSIEKTYVEMRLVKAVGALAGVEFGSAAQVAAWWKEHKDHYPTWPHRTVAEAPASD